MPLPVRPKPSGVSSAGSAGETPDGGPESSLKYAKRRHPWQWVSGAVVLLLLAMLTHLLIASDNMHWPVVWSYLFSAPIMGGVGRTLLLTVLAMAIGVAVGVLLAVARMSGNVVLRWVSIGYITIMRSIPLLVLILVVYFIAALVPQLSLGVPFGPSFVKVQADSLISAMTAAVIALGFGQAAYTAEIVRGGILAVDRGQVEAAHALGMPPGRTMTRIVLPQAVRVIIPAIGNETIGMLKATSLVSVIGYTELLTTAQSIYSATFQTIPLLTVVCIWYLVLTAVASIGQHFLELRVGRGFTRAGA
jgi:polar amino acid transport system permease protein